MTPLAVDHMVFTDCGCFAPGMVADLVLFDPEMVSDRATPESSRTLGREPPGPGGQGGVFADGQVTDARTGVFLAR